MAWNYDDGRNVYRTSDGSTFTTEQEAQRYQDKKDASRYTPDREQMKREAAERVNEWLKWLNAVKELVVEIQGHHDADNNELEAKGLHKLLLTITSSKWFDYVERLHEDGGGAADDTFAQYDACIPMYCINAQIAYINWASQLARKGDYAGAAAACSEAIEFGGKHVGMSYFRRGIYNLQTGNKEQAVEDLKKGADYGDAEALQKLKGMGIDYTPKNLPLPPPKFTSRGQTSSSRPSSSSSSSSGTDSGTTGKESHLVRNIIIAIIAVIVLYNAVPLVLGLLKDKTASSSQLASATATVTADSLNMRSAPSTSGNIIKALKKGDTLDVTGNTEKGWVPVKHGNDKGYVSADYISITTATATKGGTNAPQPTDFSQFIGTWKRDNYGNTLTFTEKTIKDSEQRITWEFDRYSGNKYFIKGGIDSRGELIMNLVNGNIELTGDGKIWDGTWKKQ